MVGNGGDSPILYCSPSMAADVFTTKKSLLGASYLEDVAGPFDVGWNAKKGVEKAS